jgi:hypothetical protein
MICGILDMICGRFDNVEDILLRSDPIMDVLDPIIRKIEEDGVEPFPTESGYLY